MKNLLLLKDRNGELFYERTVTKTEVIEILEKAILHIKNPEKHQPPGFTNNLDVYAVINDILGF